MAINFISYLRVSTDRQGALGLGIDAQREAVRQYVSGVGGNLIEEHVEVETGKSTTRPILLRSIARCRRDRAVLIIARLDRLARVGFFHILPDGRRDRVCRGRYASSKQNDVADAGCICRI